MRNFSQLVNEAAGWGECGSDPTECQLSIPPRYAWIDYNITNKNTYGALYNWVAVNSGKLCPTGWHVPDVGYLSDLHILTTYLGGERVVGGKLKAIGTIEEGNGLWHTPNEGATNESGFTAIPFSDGKYGNWWTSDEFAMSHGIYFGLDFNSTSIDSSYEGGWAYDSKFTGKYVRCLKDK